MKASKYRKVTIIFTIITIIVALISATFEFFVRMYISYNNDSIGIIGGADGPTAIFITGVPFSNSITIIFALISVLGILYLIFTRKEKE